MGVAGQEDVEQEDLQQDTTTNEAQHTEEQQEQPQGDQQGESAQGAEEVEDEDVVQIGDEEPPASEEQQTAPKWVKDLRDRQRQLAKENEQLRAQLGAGQPAAQGKPQLPAKPKLADYDYDEEKFEQARDAWDAKKREVDAWEATQQAAAEERKRAVQAVHDNYAKSRQGLKVKDFQVLEDEVKAQFSQVQQSIVMAGAGNPALLVAALGSNPKKLQELASIKDPVKFAVAVGKLETEVKVTKRTSTKPAPDAPLRSTTTTGASKATLDRLEAEAAKTGDRSKVIAWKRQQRDSGK